MFEDYKIYLLSKSPRRAQLLHSMGLNFQIIKPAIQEVYPKNMRAEEIPVFLSKLKTSSLLNDISKDISKDAITIAADTVVLSKGNILGKPKSREEAYSMLKNLSSGTHSVVSGVTISYRDVIRSFSETTQVEFSNLTDQEIVYYIDSFKPYDKAGAYGIQEWIGLIGVRSITGCFYNVMGLPTPRLYEELKKIVTK